VSFAPLTPPEATAKSIEDLLRDVRSGKVRLPQFQRSFRWEQKNILDLFDSIYHGYPIGSLLFWDTDKHTEGTAALFASVSFASPPRGGHLLVVDGQQRLTALVATLLREKRPDEPGEEDFFLFFDLDTSRFRIPTLKDGPAMTSSTDAATVARSIQRSRRSGSFCPRIRSRAASGTEMPRARSTASSARASPSVRPSSRPIRRASFQVPCMLMTKSSSSGVVPSLLPSTCPKSTRICSATVRAGQLARVDDPHAKHPLGADQRARAEVDAARPVRRRGRREPRQGRRRVAGCDDPAEGAHERLRRRRLLPGLLLHALLERLVLLVRLALLERLTLPLLPEGDELAQAGDRVVVARRAVVFGEGRCSVEVPSGGSPSESPTRSPGARSM
jgi:hypothetical protein